MGQCIGSTATTGVSADTDAALTRSGHDDAVRVTRAGVVASACLGVAVIAQVAAVVLSWGLRSSYDAIMFCVYNVTLTAVGALLASRLPRNPVGWILCLFGVQGAVTSELATGWGVRAVEEGWAGGEAAQWVGLVSWAPGALMWVLALLYTPTGRLPGRRWRAVVWAGVAGTAAYIVGWSFSPSSVNGLTGEGNPFVVDWLPAQELAMAGAALLCLSAGGALLSLVVRFRHADQVVRQQLKWVGLAAALLVLFLPVSIALWSRSSMLQVVSPLALLTMALALAAAVLRYRLFEVDLIILRAAAYACVTVLVVAVYAALSVFLGIIIGRSTAWQVAAATITAAAVFRPALRSMRRVIDKRFDRDGHAARLQVDAFLEGLRSGTEQPDRIQDVLREALREPHLRLLLYLPTSDGYADLRGAAAELEPNLAAVRVERHGVPEAVAQYPDTGDPARACARPPAPGTWAAGAAGGATYRRAQPPARPARTVPRPDRGGRRRGAPPHPARPARRRPAAAADGRHRVTRHRKQAADDRRTPGRRSRRRAGRGPRRHHRGAARADPSAPTAAARLGDRRCVPRACRTRPIPVIVDADPDRLDHALEATAYFVGCEGLTNVIKHSRAKAATLRTERRNGSLFVSVADDGVGGARMREGSGLAGLADRVAAVGGQLHVESGTRGTLVTAELPCG